MKYVVVGTSHFGFEAVETILKGDKDAEIHLYERGATASYMSCGSQSYLEGISKDLDEMHFANEKSYRDQGINIHCNSDVIGLNGDKKTILVKDLDGEHEESYDKLLLSPGAYANMPPFENNDLENIFLFRGRELTGLVKERMEVSKKAVVIGGGYIGIEVAEAFAKRGIDVTLVDLVDRVLNTYLDKEFTDVLEENSQKHGLKLRLGESVKGFKGEDGKVTAVITDKGEIPCDTAIVSVGVKPNTGWLKGSIEMDERGFVKVDEYLRTSIKDVWAGGDATYVPYAPTGGKAPIALATMARRQGVVAALNSMGGEIKVPEMNGTSSLELFDYKFSSTGLRSQNQDLYNGKVASKYVEERIFPKFMRKDDIARMKIFFDEESHVILGGQLMSTYDISGAINVISLAISNKMTLEELALSDFFYQPGFDRPWNFINVLAMAALDFKFGGADKILF